MAKPDMVFLTHANKETLMDQVSPHVRRELESREAAALVKIEKLRADFIDEKIREMKADANKPAK